MLTASAELSREADRADRADIDLDRVRAETPSVRRTVHLDNAGASPIPTPVHERVVQHLEREQEVGGYAAAREVQAEGDGFYHSTAALVGADPGEIAFAESATRAWNMLFYAIPFDAGDRILVGRSEYVSHNLAMIQMARKRGVEVRIVPDGDDGTLDVNALEDMLDERVRLVSVCHVPTSNGLRNDAESVGKLLQNHPALYLLDACQSVGQIDLDVTSLGCDMLSGTGRKFLRGPRGTGFLYVAAQVLQPLEPPFVDMRDPHCVSNSAYRLRDDARRFESWEFPVAAKLGLKVAIDYAMSIGLEAIERRVCQLADTLRTALSGVAGVELCDRGSRQSGIVTFRVEHWEADAVRARLNASAITVSAIEARDAPLDLGESSKAAIVRASVHYFNTEGEINRLRNAVAALASGRE